MAEGIADEQTLRIGRSLSPNGVRTVSGLVKCRSPAFPSRWVCYGMRRRSALWPVYPFA